MMKNTVSRQQGFTLIEVMVVVVILGILATAVVSRIMGNPDRARKTMASVDIKTLEGALQRYKMDNYVYPDTDQGLEALVTKPTSPEPQNWQAGGYVDRLPMDPWKQPYQYLSPGVHGSIDVYSLGPDQVPSDDDITNWNPQP